MPGEPAGSLARGGLSGAVVARQKRVVAALVRGTDVGEHLGGVLAPASMLGNEGNGDSAFGRAWWGGLQAGTGGPWELLTDRPPVDAAASREPVQVGLAVEQDDVVLVPSGAGGDRVGQEPGPDQMAKVPFTESQSARIGDDLH